MENPRGLWPPGIFLCGFRETGCGGGGGWKPFLCLSGSKPLWLRTAAPRAMIAPRRAVFGIFIEAAGPMAVEEWTNAGRGSRGRPMAGLK
ncbi:MAG: hypothetical protein CMH76_02760 [Nitrospinae bacterium]|nr:hypothetical protein [Nitrospinota bacterium]